MNLKVASAVVSLIGAWPSLCGCEPVLGAMQAFRDYCLGANPSLEAVSIAASQHKLKLAMERKLPGDGGAIIQRTWIVEDQTGNYSLTVAQGEGSKESQRVLCGVTLPQGVEKAVELELSEPEHFGNPDEHRTNPDGSTPIRWVKSFDWGTAEIGLLDQIPSLQGTSMLNIRYTLK